MRLTKKKIKQNCSLKLTTTMMKSFNKAFVTLGLTKNMKTCMC